MAKKAVVEATETPVTRTIVLHFKKPVEIRINGIPYNGKEIEVKEMKVAAEIVRLAKEGYGWDILA